MLMFMELDMHIFSILNNFFKFKNISTYSCYFMALLCPSNYYLTFQFYLLSDVISLADLKFPFITY